MSAVPAPIIGIRDSGVGGLTVARRVRQLLPHATLLYFADTAHVPYGERTPDEVRHFALSISEFLLAEGAELLVFACNTSSAYALELARERFTAPVVGMIEPGARAALAIGQSRQHPIGVLATQATVDSGVYTACMQGLGAGCLEVACPEFVPLVEKGETTGERARCAAAAYMRPLLAAGAQTVVLGCTHYPLLLPVLREAAPDIRFIDPAEAVAEEVLALVRERFPTPHKDGLSHDGASRFFVSGPDDGVRDWVAKLMEIPRRKIEIRTGPVFDLCVPAH